MRYGYIYISLNTLTGFSYIGIHKGQRFSRAYVGSGTIIRSIIKKHGKHIFDVQLLEWCNTKDHAAQLERVYIKLYRRLKRDLYNIADGGYGGRGPSKGKSSPPNHKGTKRSPATRQKMSQSKRGWKPSEETRRKMSESAKTRTAGRTRSIEVRQKMSAIAKENKSWLRFKHNSS